MFLTSCDDDLPITDGFLYVDPMIGTGAHYSEDAADLWGTTRKQKPIPTSHLGTMAGYDQAHDPGQCIPAVLMPHGMNFWVAQTEDTEQKEIAPYYYQDDEIQGFRNSHWIVGGMTQDYGTFTLMPLGSELIQDPIARGSKFSHDEEVATPAFYSVNLQRYGVKAELTATTRAAIFRFTYQQAGDVYLVVNPNSDEGLGRVAYDPETGQITGSNPAHRIYQGWGEYCGFDGHFTVSINKEILEGGVYAGDSLLAPGTMSIDTKNDRRTYPKKFVPSKNRRQVGAYVKYHVEAGETVLVKAASSFTDITHAQANLQQEIPDWDFDSTRDKLTQTWRQTLNRVEAKSHDEALKTSFYTALYHASFLPRTFNDCDGSYPSFGGGKELRHTDDTYYEDYSMWDTYRALHPLICLLEPKLAGDMVQSLLDKYDDGGWLPIFPCWNSYTSEMIGDHCCALVGDAYFKGIQNFDQQKALEALLKNAYEQPATQAEYKQGKGRRALQSYLKYGFIPMQDSVPDAFHTREQTSRTLEYAYDDYVLMKLCEGMGADTAIIRDLYRRAQYYKNVYNPKLGWVDGRNADSTWVNGDPFTFQKYICEGKPCHYTWYVPHDIEGLMRLIGSDWRKESRFVEKLDKFFEEGSYWHGNEPCHQISYLYNYAGTPWKTQERVRRIMKEEYGLAADGLAGNDDAGQMSAWYLFSAMGFYPVCPGSSSYVIGSPCFPELTIHNSNGHDFVIKAKGASEQNIYIQSARLNGKPYKFSYIEHEDIVAGGELELTMGKLPNTEWCSNRSSYPPSMTNDDKYQVWDDDIIIEEDDSLYIDSDEAVSVPEDTVGIIE